MPGINWSVFGCGSNRRHKGLGIFKFPSVDTPERTYYMERRMLNILKRTRVVTADFKKQIKDDHVYTCEKHFRDEDINVSKRKTLKFNDDLFPSNSVYRHVYCEMLTVY